MGRWWTGYTSISAGRAGIAHSHGEPWRFAAAWRLQPPYCYGPWKTKITSEKKCCIAAYGGAGCEFQDKLSVLIRPQGKHGDGIAVMDTEWYRTVQAQGGTIVALGG